MKVVAGVILMACCLAAQSGEKSGPEEIRIQRYLAATMRDGVKLYGDLYRPAREGKFPTRSSGHRMVFSEMAPIKR